MKKRLPAALAAYGVLIVLACVLLSGRVLGIVLILLAAFILKTVIALKSQDEVSAGDDVSE
jgi:hypothetical protein